MANTEGPEGNPPSAWVWSQYRGVLPAAAETPAASPADSAPRAGGRHGLVGLGLAAAVIVIAGLTWLFTTKTASGPSPDATAPAATENAPQQTEAQPPAADQSPAAVAPAPAAPAPAAEEPKAAPPAAHPDHAKKKKKRQG